MKAPPVKITPPTIFPRENFPLWKSPPPGTIVATMVAAFIGDNFLGVNFLGVIFLGPTFKRGDFQRGEFSEGGTFIGGNFHGARVLLLLLEIRNFRNKWSVFLAFIIKVQKLYKERQVVRSAWSEVASNLEFGEHDKYFACLRN